jgi:hypothetical protein
MSPGFIACTGPPSAIPHDDGTGDALPRLLGGIRSVITDEEIREISLTTRNSDPVGRDRPVSAEFIVPAAKMPPARIS